MPKALKPAPTKKFGAFGRAAENEIAVRREALGRVDHPPHADLRQRGHAGDRVEHVRLEMIEVVVEQPKREIGGNVAAGPGLRIGLIAAHHEAADLFLEIRAAIGIAQRRRVALPGRELASVTTY